MSRTIIARGAALAAATMLALTACGGTDDSAEAPDDAAAGVEEQEAEQDGTSAEDADIEDADAEDADAEDAEEGEDADADSADEEDDDSAAAGEGTAVEIGTEFTDEETGDVITIVSAVRDNPTEFYKATDNPDGEMIYLEVKVVPGDIYGGVVSQRDFLLEDGGKEVNYAASADDELIDAGYEYLDGASRRDGEATGYIPIYVETTSDTIKGAYVRPEMKILGSDETVPEFRGEFEVPAA